MLNGDAQGHLV